MSLSEPEIDELLARASAGDRDARGELLERHRERLRRLLAVRMDRRLAARVDPEDVIQDALLEADRRLDGYLRDRPLPLYPWLRAIALERLIAVHRHDVHAARRSVLK